MHKLRVGVLRGGPSSEYDVSLQTGATVLRELSPEAYIVHDILIDRSGTWHKNGLPSLPHDILTHLDVVFNALHGEYGEDGKVQHILEVHGIPFTGSKSFASAIGMNKSLSKEVYTREKMKTPRSQVVGRDTEGKLEIFKSFSLPIILKPLSGGSSIGIAVVTTYKEFEAALESPDAFLAEEFISGVEATCGVIDDFRDQDYYALPPIEIRPHTAGYFDYDAKYKGKSDEIVPGNFTHEQKKELEKLAIQAHKALGLRHYSRSDFIIHPKRGIFILETNTLPGLTQESLIPKALNAVGASLSHFLDHVLQLALSRK